MNSEKVVEVYCHMEDVEETEHHGVTFSARAVFFPNSRTLLDVVAALILENASIRSQVADLNRKLEAK